MKAKYKITIPLELPTMNEMIAAAKKGRRGYQPYSVMKKEYTNLCAMYTKKVIKKPIDNPIFLEITWYCKNKRKDMDNVASAKKFILDGLQQAGAIKNDGWKEISGWTEKFEIDKNNPRVEIIINE